MRAIAAVEVVMRQLLFAFLLFTTFASFAGAGEDKDSVHLDASQDMAALGQLARSNGVPILLVFSTEDCRYCQQLEAEVLAPMMRAGVDPKRVILRKVLMDETETLRDFSGHEQNAETFGIVRGVDVVPTLQLVNAEGEELVPKIVGYQVPGLYDAYLEKAIQVSQSLLASH
jgi:thioredoxin-related protein